MWRCCVCGCSLSGGKLTVAFNASLLSGDKVVLYGNLGTMLDRFSSIISQLPMIPPPHTRGSIYSAWCPCLSDADWCLQSDGIPDSVFRQKYGVGQSGRYGMTGGSYLDVQTDAANFCMEPAKTPNGSVYCPTWAGGSGTDGTSTSF